MLLFFWPPSVSPQKSTPKIFGRLRRPRSIQKKKPTAGKIEIFPQTAKYSRQYSFIFFYILLYSYILIFSKTPKYSFICSRIFRPGLGHALRGRVVTVVKCRNKFQQFVGTFWRGPCFHRAVIAVVSSLGVSRPILRFSVLQESPTVQTETIFFGIMWENHR